MADSSDVLIGGETINADNIGLEKQHWSPQKKKQFLIIGAISITILILVIIIIVIAVTSGSKDENVGPTPDKSEDDHDPNQALGEIKAYYDIKSIQRPTMILSPNYLKSSSFSIYIDDKFIKYSKEYTFERRSLNQLVSFKIYENINLDNMFKGVQDLIRIEITSSKNLKISSMNNVFEDCTELSAFTINGCDTSEITSVKNLFRNSGIQDIDIAGLSLNNIKDMSYMFANSKLHSLDLSKLNTANVENMAGMFKLKIWLVCLKEMNLCKY